MKFFDVLTMTTIYVLAAVGGALLVFIILNWEIFVR